MIDPHHLVYAGVLLLFFTCAAIVALAGFLALGAGLLTAVVVRYTQRRNLCMLPRAAPENPKTAELSMLMEESVESAGQGQARIRQDAGGRLEDSDRTSVCIGTAPVEASVSTIRWRRNKTAI